MRKKQQTLTTYHPPSHDSYFQDPPRSRSSSLPSWLQMQHRVGHSMGHLVLTGPPNFSPSFLYTGLGCRQISGRVWAAGTFGLSCHLNMWYSIYQNMLARMNHKRRSHDEYKQPANEIHIQVHLVIWWIVSIFPPKKMYTLNGEFHLSSDFSLNTTHVGGDLPFNSVLPGDIERPSANQWERTLINQLIQSLSLFMSHCNSSLQFADDTLKKIQNPSESPDFYPSWWFVGVPLSPVHHPLSPVYHVWLVVPSSLPGRGYLDCDAQLSGRHLPFSFFPKTIDHRPESLPWLAMSKESEWVDQPIPERVANIRQKGWHVSNRKAHNMISSRTQRWNFTWQFAIILEISSFHSPPAVLQINVHIIQHHQPLTTWPTSTSTIKHQHHEQHEKHEQHQYYPIKSNIIHQHQPPTVDFHPHHPIPPPAGDPYRSRGQPWRDSLLPSGPRALDRPVHST